MKRQTDVVFVTCKDDARHRFAVPRRTLSKDAFTGREPSRRCPECAERIRREKRRMAAPYLVARIGRTTPVSPWELPLACVSHPEPDVQPATVDGDDENFSFTITAEDVASVRDAFQTHQVVVVSAGTGSGKSSRLVADLAMGLGPEQPGFAAGGQVVVTQPRRRATEGCARALAQLLGSGPGPGQIVGFRHADRDESDHRVAILVATDGTILQRLRGSDLAGISLLVLDEVHEASENIELLLARIAELLPRFPETRLLLLSATIDPAPFVASFGGPERVVVFQFAGSPKEVDVHWRVPEEALPYDDAKRIVQVARDAAVATTIDVLTRALSGELPLDDILVFVARQDDVEYAVARVEEAVAFRHPDRRVLVVPLTKDVTRSTQERACARRSAEYEVKVVAATPIAETSLTIDGLGHVIDSGLAVVKRFDSATQADVYEVRPHTRAGIRQRWGRVGRTRAGHVWTTYSEAQFATFREHARSGLDGANLEGPLLTLAASGVRDLNNVHFTHAVDSNEAARALDALVSSGLILEDGELTRLGLEVSGLPLPRPHAQLLVLADRLACGFEASMLVELSKVWQRVWTWDRRWDGVTKGAIADRRHALTTGCVDDLDLGIRIAGGWLGLLQGQDVAGEKWARRFALDVDGLEEFARSWSTLWSGLATRTRGAERRSVDPRLVARVRGILALRFQQSQFVSADGYFERATPSGLVRLVPDRSTTVDLARSSRVIPLVEVHAGRDRGFPRVRGELLAICPDLGETAGGHVLLTSILKRAIDDGRLPVGCYADFPASVGAFVEVRSGRVHRVSPPPPPPIVRVGEAQPIAEGDRRGPLLAVAREVSAVWCDASVGDGNGIVERYDGAVAVVQRSSAAVPGLDEFAKSIKVGSTVTAVAAGARSLPGGDTVLLVEHQATGLRVCVGPEELGIADDNELPVLIPMGAMLDLSVEEVDPAHERVLLSAIPAVAGDYVEVLSRPSVEATVVRRGSNMTHVRFPGIHVRIPHEVRVNSQLPASLEGVLRVALSVPEDRLTFAAMGEIPDSLLRKMDNSPALTWDSAARALKVRGRMATGAFRLLLMASEAASHRRVLRNVWRRSAAPAVQPLIDAEVAALFSKAVPGESLPARIVGSGESFARLDFGYGVSGRIFRRDMPFDASPADIGASGDVINVWITQVDRDRKEVRATPFDWMRQWKGCPLTSGQYVAARVSWIPDDGSCVNLEFGDGIVGRVAVSDLVGEVKLADFVVGSVVQVVVRRVDAVRRQVKAVPAVVVEIFQRVADAYPRGTPIRGQVTAVRDFGAFIDLGSGFTALLPRSFFAGREIAVGEDIDVAVHDINPERCQVTVR